MVARADATESTNLAASAPEVVEKLDADAKKAKCEEMSKGVQVFEATKFPADYGYLKQLSGYYYKDQFGVEGKMVLLTFGIAFGGSVLALALALAALPLPQRVYSRLKRQGVTLVMEADESSTGPASCVLSDPDGNQILIDQHI